MTLAKTASAPDSFFTASLEQADPEIAAAIKGDLDPAALFAELDLPMPSDRGRETP